MPQFVTSTDLPFMSAHWQAVRSHHYMPYPIGAAFEDFFTNIDIQSEAVDWCEKVLRWPISSYKEYWGSLNLVLPNPLYREKEYFVSAADVETEQVSCRFVPRISADPTRSAKLKENFDNLMMYQVERHAGFFFGFLAHPVKEEIKLHSKMIEHYTNMVVCPRRGILDYSPWTFFIKGFNISMETSINRNIPFKIGDHELTCTGQYSTGYQAPKSWHIGHIENLFFDWREQYRDIRVERETKSATRGKEVWLDDKQGAKQTIEGIIKTARQRLIVVDPYFGTTEILNLLTKISFSTVQSTILTSIKPFKTEKSADDDAYFSSLKKHDYFNTALEEFAKHWPKASVRVMLGGHIIHDRFLVVDDAVWLSGNSFNNIGDKASMLVKLDNPEAIIKKIKAACNDGKSKTWDKSYEEYKSKEKSMKVSSDHDR